MKSRLINVTDAVLDGGKQSRVTLCLCVSHLESTKMNRLHSLANISGFDLLMMSNVLLAAE